MTGASIDAGGGRIGARPAGFWRDLLSVAGRALRAVPREPAALVPALIVPLFFVVNVGALSDISTFVGVGDFEAFQLPVAIVFVLGVGFATGPLGVLAFLLLSGLWGLAFTGFPYAIALRTGNPAAVNSSFILFFPFAFLTTTFLPQEALTGWLATVADYNPVTYLLAGLRALISSGWVLADLLPAIAAVALVALVSFSLAFSALRARVRN
ncbi:MAG: ABC transporter protein [uncultured Rubrobacteraceae bacterium]|uniref:ABC transporter protein n=1 Tax=uncultured Rubrobacteraceae bacterium TaxID=349277 RepID=A0A6J4RNH2_9ACTN|nr:MAG: ABC transporter protein [uncultured Rubrobacteraceae bacterium]